MNKKIFWIVLAVLALIIGGLVYWNLSQRAELTELIEQMTIEKEELQEEYEDLAIQFDGYQSLDIRNDSLQDLLSREQQRVQDLLEELRQTKASNARKIAELKKELATVRAVMKDYVRQIDSLNATNQRLTVENQRVHRENQEVRSRNEHLTQQNSALTETVTRASMLEITSCVTTSLNKNDHKTKMAAHIKKLQFDYVIAKNITCPPGIKQLYAQIVDPNGVLLGESADHVFPFENQEIAYSLRQELEYNGDAYTGSCYFTLDDEYEIIKGDYFIDFFCDGNMIGSFLFVLKK